MIDPAIIAAFRAAGASSDMIVDALEHYAREKAAEKRQANREKVARWRAEKNPNECGERVTDVTDVTDVTAVTAVTDVTVTMVTSPPLKERSPPTPPSKENNPPMIFSSLRSEKISLELPAQRGPKAGDFERFYAAFPKKINKKSAAARFATAVKAGIDPEHIIAAASRFAEAHRAAMTECQFIPAPDVWLNKGRYDDEHLPVPLANSRAGPPKKISAITEAILSLEAQIERENENPALDCGPVQQIPGLVLDGP